MILNTKQAFALLKLGIECLSSREAKRKERWGYYSGKEHELPFAPDGVSQEYIQLREMSPFPLIRLAVRTPLQRTRLKGIRFESDEITKRHRQILNRNRMRSHQRPVYVNSLVYSTGIIGVWPNDVDRQYPLIRSQNPNNVWVEFDPDDENEILWSVKHWTDKRIDEDGKFVDVEHGIVYDDQVAFRFERTYTTAYGAASNVWSDDPKVISHGLGVNPMTPFLADLNADGRGTSFVDPLMPMQRAIDTMRFDLLLAAQFAAYRQRVATGYDPVLRDADGMPIYKQYPVGHPQAGQLILDDNQLPIPVVQSPGKVGVNRLLTFPGTDTKIFDLPESRLENYVTGLNLLVSTFAAAAQLPPGYMGATDFKNVSAELMTSTEATMQSLIKDLQVTWGESHQLVAQKVGLATGDDQMVDYDAEAEWEPTGPVSLAEIADFASKVVPLGYPLREVVEKIPDTSQAQSDQMELTPPPVAPTPGEPAGTAIPGEPGQGVTT